MDQFPFDFFAESGAIEDTKKPSDVKLVTTVSGVSGPTTIAHQSFEKALDFDKTTKLCTGDTVTPIVVFLGGEKELKGISIVNGEDNNGGTRTVIAYEVWVSEDGVNWGEAPAWSCDGTGVNRAEVGKNHAETYRGFDEAITATYVKIKINNGGMYQFSELLFYE